MDECPVKAAAYHFDVHAVKMPLEAQQILCTNVSVVLPGYRDENLFKPTHVNHPCTVWARTVAENHEWLVRHCAALFAEYTKRYGRVHACQAKLEALCGAWGKMLVALPEHGGITPPSLCMPEELRSKDAVESYRAYYKHKIANDATQRKFVWKRTTAPAWA